MSLNALEEAVALHPSLLYVAAGTVEAAMLSGFERGIYPLLKADCGGFLIF